MVVAYGVAVAEGFPGVAYEGVREVAVVVGVVFFVGGQVVPVGDGGTNLGMDKFSEDVTMTEKVIVLCGF